MSHPDQQAPARFLLLVGVEQGDVDKLLDIYPPSVVAMARLWSWSDEMSKSQFPEAKGDIAATGVTEEMIRTDLVTVYMAARLQDEEIDHKYGSRRVVLTLRHDLRDGRTDVSCLEIGNSNGVRPQTAANMALRQLLRGREFRRFFQSRMSASTGKGRRLVDEIKEIAANKITSGGIKMAASVA